jgi:DHA1 family tetracycline resistance protein-like MFS transporter
MKNTKRYDSQVISDDPMRPYRVKIFTVLLLDSLCVGINIPNLPQMITHQMKQDVSIASSYFGLIMSMTALINFVVSPLVGALSDRYGRKKMILFSTMGSSLHYLILFLAMYLFQDVRGIYLIIIGRIISGITGHSIMLSFAYISDVSERSKRAQHFGLIGTSFGIAFLIGPALGGALGSFIHLSVPFALTSIIQFFNSLNVIFLLDETLHLHRKEKKNKHKDPIEVPVTPVEDDMILTINEENVSGEVVVTKSLWKQANPLNSFNVLFHDRFIMILSAALLINSIASTGFQNVWVHYTNYRFGWTTMQSGLFFTAGGVCTAIVQGYLLQVIVPRLGERNCVYYGLILGTIINALIAVIGHGWMLYPLIPFNALSGVALPALRAQLTKPATGAHTHGALQGSLASLQTLARIIGPLVTTNLFRFVTSSSSPIHFPGAPFAICAILELSSLLIVWYSFTNHPEIEKKD